MSRAQGAGRDTSLSVFGAARAAEGLRGGLEAARREELVLAREQDAECEVGGGKFAASEAGEGGPALRAWQNALEERQVPRGRDASQFTPELV